MKTTRRALLITLVFMLCMCIFGCGSRGGETAQNGKLVTLTVDYGEYYDNTALIDFAQNIWILESDTDNSAYPYEMEEIPDSSVIRYSFTIPEDRDTVNVLLPWQINRQDISGQYTDLDVVIENGQVVSCPEGYNFELESIDIDNFARDGGDDSQVIYYTWDASLEWFPSSGIVNVNGEYLCDFATPACNEWSVDDHQYHLEMTTAVPVEDGSDAQEISENLTLRLTGGVWNWSIMDQVVIESDDVEVVVLG